MLAQICSLHAQLLVRFWSAGNPARPVTSPVCPAQLLPVSLACRQYSAKLEMYRQVASQVAGNSTVRYMRVCT